MKSKGPTIGIFAEHEIPCKSEHKTDEVVGVSTRIQYGTIALLAARAAALAVGALSLRARA